MKALIIISALVSSCATTQLVQERHAPTRGGVYMVPSNVVFPWHARWVSEDREAIVSSICGSSGVRIDYSQTLRDQYGVNQRFEHFTCGGTP